MTRGGRSALKTLEPSQVDVQRVLRFKLLNSATDEEDPHLDVQGTADALTEYLSGRHAERTVDVMHISNDSIFITSISSFYL